MKIRVVIISLMCCMAGYLLYEHYFPCVASIKEIPMKISSTAFEHKGKLPIKYTGHGENINPPLQFHGVPAQAKSLVLVMSDPDAPQPQPWIHWVLFNIPPQTTEIKEDASVEGAKHGKNTAQTTKYYGANPPKGHGVHHYYFILYALDKELDLPEGTSYENVKQAIQGHIIAQAELVGLYETV